MKKLALVTLCLASVPSAFAYETNYNCVTSQPSPSFDSLQIAVESGTENGVSPISAHRPNGYSVPFTRTVLGNRSECRAPARSSSDLIVSPEAGIAEAVVIAVPNAALKSPVSLFRLPAVIDGDNDGHSCEYVEFVCRSSN